jgi:hypothetical protein
LEPLLWQTLGASVKKIFGKYRGKVEKNKDPEGLGRLLVSCPSVMGQETNWAMPSVPYAGKSVGFFALPPVQTNVWVEFEGGNIDLPIWAGCFWNKGEVPAKRRLRNSSSGKPKPRR